MEIQLIRNATMKITYGGHTILTDPMLSPKGAFRSFANIAKNPTVELPFPVEDVINGVEAAVVTHYHPDHFDQAAGAALPKRVAVFCQPGDEARFVDEGFSSVTPIQRSHTWQGITITRTEGRHGSGKVLEMMGKVSGFVFQADGEPTVYWVGDSIWCEPVEQSIAEFKPDVIITHSGGAKLPDFDPIIMDAEQTLTTIHASGKAIVVAVHMEALDHCGVSREALRRLAEEKGISPNRLSIPEDGAVLSF
jgi:L-ascorbate metabolism protein UlaG (beta-lactamase superfamily)